MLKIHPRQYMNGYTKSTFDDHSPETTKIQYY